MTNEILQIVFSGVVTISTVVYSLLTWRLVSETKKLREFQITPDINIFFERAEADASFVFIVFKNFGQGHANNVRFKIIKDFDSYDFEHLQLKDLRLIKDGIEIFYSNQMHKYYLTDLSNNSEQKRKANFIIEVSYSSFNKKVVKKIFNLTFADIIGKSVFTPPETYVGRISYELNQIRKILSDINKSKEN